ncbi:MAG: hypothetical protein HUU08_02605, partial [Candidatus Brocadia sp.]|nr:hypothetical protein [Candidatus Brocadia sp.]
MLSILLQICKAYLQYQRQANSLSVVDYPWSSYPKYAYGKKLPEWLRTAPILSRFDAKDKNTAYREMVQSYSREEKRLWENFRHGLFLGSEQF